MELDATVFLYGIGADGKSGIFGSTTGLVDRFGAKRVFDTPIAEQGLTAMALGAAVGGLRPVLVHQRFDFMLYSADQLANWIAPWRFISGGRAKVPLTLRIIVGKGWGQGPQHSRACTPGSRMCPGCKSSCRHRRRTPKDFCFRASSVTIRRCSLRRARSTQCASRADAPYFIKIGEALARRPGNDLTLVALSSMIPPSLQAAEDSSEQDIDVEVVDLRTLMPLDMTTRDRHRFARQAAWSSPSQDGAATEPPRRLLPEYPRLLDRR